MNEPKRRYLEFFNYRTGQVSERVDVTGESEHNVAKTLRGMLINIGDGWIVRDTAREPPIEEERSKASPP